MAFIRPGSRSGFRARWLVFVSRLAWSASSSIIRAGGSRPPILSWRPFRRSESLVSTAAFFVAT